MAGDRMNAAEQYHCRLCNLDVCEHPHATANFTDVTEEGDPALAGAAVLSETDDLTAGGDPRIKMYLAWDGKGHFHQIELAGDGLRYLAELLARIYGVTLPSDVSDLERDYHAGEPEQAERARRELARRGICHMREGA
jgi:hypothetical protein